MRNTSETICDVAFNNPFGSCTISTGNLSQGGDGTVLFPKSMRAFTKDGFIDGFQNERDTCLYDFVPAGGNTQRAELPVAFGNVHPPNRLRLIPTSS